jgi:hypothetical protein
LCWRLRRNADARDQDKHSQRPQDIALQSHASVLLGLDNQVFCS